MEKRILDANVLLRFLRADDPTQYKKAQKLFVRAENGKIRLILLDVVIAEVVFVLTSVYKYDRIKVSNALQPFLTHGGIDCEKSAILSDSLNRFATINVDYMDCYLAAVAYARGCTISSFDRDFRKFKDIDWKIPGD